MRLRVGQPYRVRKPGRLAVLRQPMPLEQRADAANRQQACGFPTVDVDLAGLSSGTLLTSGESAAYVAVTVLLPIRRMRRATAPTRSAALDAPVSILKEGDSMKVLLIDDHPPILSALQAVILGLGSHVGVVGVATAKAAREALASDAEFDLVLLDLQLADEDGFELLVELRAAYPALPVVVVSASDRSTDVLRAIDRRDGLRAETRQQRHAVPSSEHGDVGRNLRPANADAIACLEPNPGRPGSHSGLGRAAR